MKIFMTALPAWLALASPLLAQEEEHKPSLLSINPGLIVWTLVAFGAVLWVLSRYAIPPMLEAVRAREQALEDAIAAARNDREEAAALLAQQRAQLDASRADADKLIVEARAAGEKVRSVMIDETREQQSEMLERARREIGNERDRAIAELRREAVDLALAGAARVIEKNLDDAGNRRLVESFLATVGSRSGKS
jgi:F-type H+-transporting ATPase subunit b